VETDVSKFADKLSSSSCERFERSAGSISNEFAEMSRFFKALQMYRFLMDSTLMRLYERFKISKFAKSSLLSAGMRTMWLNWRFRSLKYRRLRSYSSLTRLSERSRAVRF